MLRHLAIARLRAAAILVAALGTFAPLSAATPTGAGWTLAWNDEFEGSTMDTTKWRHWLAGSRRDAVNSPSAVAVADGALTISTYTSGVTHYTGMISTQDTYPYTYGYIEARIDYDSSPGMWSAFWMQSPSMGNPIGSPNVAGTEIDICEHRSIDSAGNNIDGLVVGNIHWDGYGAAHRSTGYTSPNLGLGTGYHVYGMEWTPTQQKFYIDGVLRWTLNNSANSPVSQRSEFIILSSEVDNGSWAGAVPAAGYGSLATSTTKMKVDYVRVYRRAETVVNGDFEGRIGPFSATGQAAWSATDGRSAPASARIAPTTGGASVEQTVRGLLPDTSYLLNAWGKAGTTAPGLFIGAKNHGAAQTGQSLATAGYSQATVPFTTGPDHRTAAVFAHSANLGSTGHVDDFLLRRAASIPNGHLEHDAAFDWTSTYGGATVSGDSTYDGEFAWRIPASGSSAGVEQEVVGLSPSTAYRLSAWTTNGNAGLTFGVKNHGGSQVTTTRSSNTWARATVDFTTGAFNTTAAVFAFRSSSAQTAYADSFFLHQPLAAPWTGQDLASGGRAGTAGRLGDRLVLQAGGNNLGGSSDPVHFVHRPLSGDGTITARVLGVDPTAYHAKTGLMIRESTAPGARSAAVVWGPVNQLVEFHRRGTPDAAASSTTTPRDITTPPWLRLTRRGNTFTAYHSPDGRSWTRVGSPQTIAMAGNALVGIPACAGDTTRLTEVAVDDVTITAPVADVRITSPAEGLTLAHNGQSLRLTATITDPGAPAIAWTKVVGPGTVTFANPGQADTSATFSAAGRYVLRCAATTAAGTGAADLTLNVAPVPAADPSLSLRLKLDESAGTTASDSSGKGLHATAVGPLAWLPAGGVLDGAASLDGTASYLVIPDSPLLDNTAAFTLSFWFRAETLGNNTGLVAKRVGPSDQNSYGIFLGLDGKLSVDVNSSNNRFTSATTFNSGRWYHVALVFNGALAEAERTRLYVNGALDTTAAETSASVPNHSSSLYIGVLAPGGNGFDGLIDEVRFHRRALAATEVAALAAETATFAPTVSGGTPPAAIVNAIVPLAGSATVESGPAPTVLWTKVGGPGNVVFGDPSQAATTATFDQAGEYRLRLTATNANAQTFAEFSDTIFPAALPVPELTITRPPAPVTLADTAHALRLTASVDTRFVPGTPAIIWSQVSGPPGVTFGDPAAADTHATFPVPGSYLLRCAVSNPGGSDQAEVAVTVAAPASLALRQGDNSYAHTATFLRSDITTWNSGARDTILVGKSASTGNFFRSVLSFPLTGIPADATLAAVSLDLWTHPSQAGTGSVAALELRPLAATPVEGTGTSSVSTAIDGNGSGATWLNRTAATAWTSPGGDFGPTVLSSVPGFNATDSGVQQSFPSTPAFLAAAQAALAAGQPLNLMLVSPLTESGPNAAFARLASDDHPTVAQRPRLTLVWSVNPAPTLDPGPAPAATTGTPAALTATASGATSTSWTLADGPGDAGFDNPSLPATSVTFSQAGLHQLRLSAANPHGEVFRTLAVTAALPPDPARFADWQALTWPGQTQPALVGPESDPDRDGLANHLEWALHLDATRPDAFRPDFSKNGDALDFTYIRRKTAPGEADFTVEWSDTLAAPWTPAVSDPPVSIDATRESVTTPIPASPDGRRFVRVRVAPSP